MIIRELNKNEVPAIARIERACFETPWSEDSIKSSLNNSSNRFFVADSGSGIIAYIGLSVVVDEGYILNVATLPEHRREGIAKDLLTYVIDLYKNDLKFLTLEVRPSNTAAIRLYESFGFEQAAIRKNYYSHPKEDALILTKFFS